MQCQEELQRVQWKFQKINLVHAITNIQSISIRAWPIPNTLEILLIHSSEFGTGNDTHWETQRELLFFYNAKEALQNAQICDFNAIPWGSFYTIYLY